MQGAARARGLVLKAMTGAERARKHKAKAKKAGLVRIELRGLTPKQAAELRKIRESMK